MPQNMLEAFDRCGLDFFFRIGIIGRKDDHTREEINMQRLGFIHDMLDVKVLILFVTSRANYPMTLQEIYETCYVDDCLS